MATGRIPKQTKIMVYVVVTSSNPYTFASASAYASFILVGYAAGVGSVILGVTKDQSTLVVKDLMTGSAWSSNVLTFSQDGNSVIISSTNANNSRFALICNTQFSG